MNEVHIDLNEATQFDKVRIINTSGKEVMTESISLNVTLNVSALENGMYILEVSGVDILPVRKKVLIKH